MVVVGRKEKRRENETEGKEKVKECAAIAMAERLMRRKERTRRQKNERKEFITSICKPLFVTMIVNKMENTVCNECVPEFHPSNWFTRYDSFIFFFLFFFKFLQQGKDYIWNFEIVVSPSIFLLYVFLAQLLYSFLSKIYEFSCLIRFYVRPPFLYKFFMLPQ